MKKYIFKLPEQVRIISALLLAFTLTQILSQTIFYSSSPRLNNFFISTIPKKISQLLSSLFPKKPTPTPTLFPSPTIIVQQPSNLPTKQALPTIASTITSTPLPTMKKITPTQFPTRIPTLTPTRVPSPTTPPKPSCPTSSNRAYGSLPVNPVSFNAQNNPDINLAIRGYIQTNAPLGLVTYGYPEGEPPDQKAPQLSTVLGDGPNFVRAYQVYDWNWPANSRGGPITEPYSVSMMGMSTYVGQAVRIPNSGYDVGEGYDAIVLYASQNRITIKYTREDNVVGGYTVHIEDFCIDPNLLSLYQNLNNSGRNFLPALLGSAVIGSSKTNELKIVIRDSGQFMDPRSRLDWWQGY